MRAEAWTRVHAEAFHREPLCTPLQSSAGTTDSRIALEMSEYDDDAAIETLRCDGRAGGALLSFLLPYWYMYCTCSTRRDLAYPSEPAATVDVWSLQIDC